MDLSLKAKWVNGYIPALRISDLVFDLIEMPR